MSDRAKAPGLGVKAPADDPVETATRQVARRLVPFLLLMYVLAFLDRANIGFAKTGMQASTAISDTAFALGAGLFFVTYAILEVPSNFMLRRVGARIWMSRIMVTWGLVSAATCLVSDEKSFYLLRLLLGAAEAGFFPGIVLYLTEWLPDRSRGRVLGLFYFGAPIAFILGGPVSGALLNIHGLGGIEGWRWMFLLEGVPAAAVGVWAYFYLDDRPSEAKWLPDASRTALITALRQESEARADHGRTSFAAALRDPRMGALVITYFLLQMSVYGVTFYLPTQVAELLGRKVGLEVGLVTAVPWTCALVTTWLLSRYADRVGAHGPLGAAALALSAAGIAWSAYAQPLGALAGLCLAASGFIAAQPLFWVFPGRFLGGAAAAGGFALINATGALGGFVAPNVKTWADGRFGSSSAGLYVLAVAALGAALMMLSIYRHHPAADIAPRPQP